MVGGDGGGGEVTGGCVERADGRERAEGEGEAVEAAGTNHCGGVIGRLYFWRRWQGTPS